jgi:hypothetical protein
LRSKGLEGGGDNGPTADKDVQDLGQLEVFGFVEIRRDGSHPISWNIYVPVLVFEDYKMR